MKNIIEFDGGYKAEITYDPEIEVFRGEFIGLPRSRRVFTNLAEGGFVNNRERLSALSSSPGNLPYA